MTDEELNKSFEPTQYPILGYVSDMFQPKDVDGIYHAYITPITVKNNDRWMPLSSSLAKRLTKIFETSIFAYQLTTKIPEFTINTIMEFRVRESSSNKGSKYTVNYKFDVKVVSLPYILPINYSKIRHQIADSFFNPDSIIIQSEKIDGKIYLQDLGDKIPLILGPFKLLNYKDAYCSMMPYTGKEIHATSISKSDLADYTMILPGGHRLLLNENEFNSLQNNQIDCMTSKQLTDWIRARIKDVGDVDRAAVDKTINLLKSQVFDDTMSKIRLNRVIKYGDSINEIINETNELKNDLLDVYIAKNPNLKKEAEEQIKSDFEKEHKRLSLQLSEIKAALEIKQEEIQKTEAEYESIESKFKEKENQLEFGLSKLKDKQIKLTEEITKLEQKRDLIGIQIEDKSSLKYFVINDIERKKFSEVCAESDTEVGLGSTLRQNAKILGLEGKIKKSLGEAYSFLNCQAVFVPNISWAYAYGYVLGKAKVAAIYPEYDWLHYRDFKDAGLEKIWIDSSIDTSYTYILYIDGLNIVTPESGLRSFLDVLAGKSLALANTGQPFPSNLKIMASMLPSVSDNPDERIGLHVRAEKFTRWGAVSEPSDSTICEITTEKDAALIQFSPDDILISHNEVNDSLWAEDKEKYLAF